MKRLIVVILRSISQRINQLQGGRDFFLLVQKKGWMYFKEKINSLAGLNKKLTNFCQNFRFGFSRLAGSLLKVNFLNLQANFQRKTPISFLVPGRGFLEPCVKSRAIYFQKSAGQGVGVLQVDLLQNSWF